ncbi:glycosyltransferase family A protein [Bacteroides salyersiae]|jgi:glycosyltransferase involved in cell wall biosynthesis|uniref:glycosyltransferase family A protein n=1 Tax=Bacteroides salyersiae TaxID=291644 RepID=UPI001C8C4B1E
MELKLSIIIPFYGEANKNMLDRCLISIHNQGMETEDYEVIIADDEGKGLGGARNIGIRKAQGKYLLFIDADDYLFPNTLLQCISLLTSHHPDILSFGYQQVSHSNETPKKNKKIENKVYPTGAAFMNKYNFMGSAWRHFFLKEWLLNHRLVFSENTYHEDEAFIAKAYFHAQTTIITNLIVYAYYQNPHSILHKQDNSYCLKRIHDFRLILTSLREFLESASTASLLQQNALQRRIHFLTIDYILQLYHNQCTYSSIRQNIKELVQMKYLPLPAKKYSWKYSITRIIINLFLHL